jgi:hypothetical protein
VSGNSIERILDKIDSEISKYLIFAGVLDNNAKLLSFRRGKASFSLPVERHDTLDVQLSLMFSLIRQLEDISGSHRFTVTRFAKYDIFLFGTSELHVFVMTLPTSEGQVVKTLAELVATMSGTDSQGAAAMVANSTGDQTIAATMTSTASRRDEYNDRQRFTAVPRPEIISVLQGYLMALEPNCTIQDDAGGHYKIKAGDTNRFVWSTLQKISSTFRDRVEVDHIGLDGDGNVFVRILLKY